VDLVVLDGEAWPTGGLGLARQMKDELVDAPPTVVLIARRDDRWLAKWSMADAVLPLPVDAPALTAACAELLRQRESGLPVRRASGR
jgi:DNA-binding response OmpR family regulator